MWPVRLCAQYGNRGATGTKERPGERAAIVAVAAEGTVRELERDDEDVVIDWWPRAHCLVAALVVQY